VRGLQHMIEDGRSCREVLTLLAGVRSALNATGDLILERYVESCSVDLQRGEASVTRAGRRRQAEPRLSRHPRLSPRAAHGVGAAERLPLPVPARTSGAAARVLRVVEAEDLRVAVPRERQRLARRTGSSPHRGPSPRPAAVRSPVITKRVDFRPHARSCGRSVTPSSTARPALPTTSARTTRPESEVSSTRRRCSVPMGTPASARCAATPRGSRRAVQTRAGRRWRRPGTPAGRGSRRPTPRPTRRSRRRSPRGSRCARSRRGRSAPRPRSRRWRRRSPGARRPGRGRPGSRRWRRRRGRGPVEVVQGVGARRDRLRLERLAGHEACISAGTTPRR
jgi:hypothetical protein